MVRINIDGTDRALSEVTPTWIKDRIEQARAAGLPVCVRVTLITSGADVAFATAGCPSTGGGWRAPNPKEKHLLDLWTRLGLDQLNFSIDKLLRFLGDIKDA
jgi:hypothetical protein